MVKEEGGKLAGTGVNALDQGGGGVAAGEGGMGGKEAEEAEAEGFAGEFAGGLDGEVGSEAGGSKTVGVKDPESEDGALVLAALEVASQEGADIVEHFGRFRWFSGLGNWFGSGWWFGFRSGDG